MDHLSSVVYNALETITLKSAVSKNDVGASLRKPIVIWIGR
jgi:hypothetical protein